MTFAAHLTRSPRPFEADRAQEIREAYDDLAPELKELLAGTGGCSPFLKGLLEKEGTWLREALSQDPAQAYSALLDETQALDDAGLSDGLRRGKRRAALFVALADLGGVWPLEEVTEALTRFADLATSKALAAAIGAEIRRGKLPGAVEEDAATGAGMVALAMGKMGACELNYSSDIDLICLFDENRFGPDDYHDARTAFIRATRKMATTLSDLTGEGYVFRTDLRLRPDPASTPVCLSMDAAEHYYESVGRTWERAAHIKARACAGDLVAGDAYLKRLTPFVWRKHLDFAAIQDAHDMRLRIRDHRGFHGPLVLEGHNIKLGSGGIREIEFFTQTRQIIAGGRDSDLRVRGTVESLAQLARKGWVPQDVTESLTGDYRAHRMVEHRLQMVQDAQTHDLPTRSDGFDRLAAFMGQDTDDLRRDLRDRLERVATLTEDFFAPGKAPQGPELSETAREIVARWKSYPALRSSRAVEVFERLKPELLSRLQKAAKPEEALVHLDGFLAGLPAGVQVFSLFEANPQLIDLIIDIASTAPGLARYLGRNSGVFDAVIGGQFFSDWPGSEAMRSELAARLAEVPDYERKLDATRRWDKEWHFRVGVHHLRGLISADEAGRQYAELAEATVGALWEPVVEEFAAKHGSPPGEGAVVLGMGSLGAARLTASSDLDLIVIYDAAGVEESQGRRPLAARAYYARLTQALLTALTAPMAEGKLYDVDMRLRPSGRQGPVATSIQSFETYQREEAWTWEHMALTRARPIAGTPDLGQRVEALRLDLLAGHRDASRTLTDVRDMRARLAEAKPGQGRWEAKLGPGRMMDIELLGQTAALLSGSAERGTRRQLATGEPIGWLTADEVRCLTRAYSLMWRLQAAARLLTGEVLDLEIAGKGAETFLLRETDEKTADDLADQLNAFAEDAAGIIDAALEKCPAGRAGEADKDGTCN